MQNYRNLQVWQQAHQLTLAVYQATAEFPPDEKYGLTSQVRRAAASVAANIVEGSARGSDADFARFLHNSTGSIAELDYHLLLAKDLGLMDAALYERMEKEITSVRRMLIAFIQKLKN